jgi:non-canonical (house-cleaning) NTP pyrophosphatase
MRKIVIAIGSKRAPKIAGLREAVAAVGPHLHPGSSFDVRGFGVETGVRQTPLSSAELMAGARGRCAALIRLWPELGGEGPRYFVGVEGGLDVIHENGVRLAFLESWAFVSDTSGRGFYGRSGAIVLPEPVCTEVLDRGTELSHAIERYAGVRGVRDAQGAWGVLTKNLIDRQEACRIAVIAAFAGFLSVQPSGASRRE